ncbi:MAG: SH3 domain-containing protein [Chloroflexi bacterium]|nr:SH3 domain-containing protein [Chloroflexota bacterium]
MFRRLLHAISIAAIAATVSTTSVVFTVSPAFAQNRPSTASQYRAIAQGSEVTVMVASLNVRAQPSLKAKIIGKLKGGAKVQTLGTSTDGAWWIINHKGVQAYIMARYTQAGGVYRPASSTKTTSTKTTTKSTSAGGFELGGHIRSTDYLGQMRDIGMTWVKTQVVMPGGAPDMSGMINAVHANGMKILIGAVGDRGRASDGEYHKEFARQLAALAAQGADAIEVWNEPNLDREYGYGKVDPANYVNMLYEAYGAIKATNPNTLVIGGANAPTGAFGGGCTANGCDDSYFVARMGQLGADKYMDCMGAHHNGSMVGPDQTQGAPTGDHYSWYFWGTLGVTYNAFGGRVPICWTELGYVTGEGIGALPGGFSWGSSTTLDNQAQWLARAAQLSRDSGKVRLMIIWNIDFRQWDADPQAGYSIFRPNGECRACGTLKAAMGR